MFLPITFLLTLSIFAGGWISFFFTPLYIIYLPFIFKICIFTSLFLVLVIYLKIIKQLNFMENFLRQKFVFFF